MDCMYQIIIPARGVTYMIHICFIWLQYKICIRISISDYLPEHSFIHVLVLTFTILDKNKTLTLHLVHKVLFDSTSSMPILHRIYQFALQLLNHIENKQGLSSVLIRNDTLKFTIRMPMVLQWIQLKLNINVHIYTHIYTVPSYSIRKIIKSLGISTQVD